MWSSRQRIWALAVAFPLSLVVLALVYSAGMHSLEGQTRDFWTSLEWVAETMTTTGYGSDNSWSSPAMNLFVVGVQFAGVGLTFLAFSLVVVPYFEERFEGRLPREAPARVRDYVLVYRHGPAVAALLDELERAGVPTVVLEEDEAVARRLFERGRRVVFAQLDDEDPDPQLFARARAVVVNGTDQQNGALIIAIRQSGFTGEIIALAERPLHRKPMMLAGANAVYTPLHMLAAAMAALASERINPRVVGLGRVRGHLHTAELRIQSKSELAGRTIAESGIRARTGATIIGMWHEGEFVPHPLPSARLDNGSILVAVGSERSLDALGKLAIPLKNSGPFVVCGYGEVGKKIAQMFRDFGEELVVVDLEPADGVDFAGDALDVALLTKAGVESSKGVVLALGDDSTTLFAAAVLRDFAPEVPIIAGVRRVENARRIHLAGADFALSLGKVAAELLAQKMLGEDWISLEARVKLVKANSTGLDDSSPTEARVRDQTGCSIVAVERGEDVTVEFSREFHIEKGDILHVCGPEDGIERYFEVFPEARI